MGPSRRVVMLLPALLSSHEIVRLTERFNFLFRKYHEWLRSNLWRLLFQFQCVSSLSLSLVQLKRSVTHSPKQQQQQQHKSKPKSQTKEFHKFLTELFSCCDEISRSSNAPCSHWPRANEMK